MSKLYIGVSALCLSALIGGTALFQILTKPNDCGGNSVAGGSSAIGGPFELLDSTGQTVTDKDVIDQPALVYFGYTFCPDVCPFDVARNVLAVDILEEQGVSVRPVFITVDPERDTQEVMAQYAEDMHPRMVALTGTDEQIKSAAQAYKVFYAKGTGEGEFYLMDHTTFTYLMMPETGLATYFGRNETPEDMAAQVACHVGG